MFRLSDASSSRDRLASLSLWLIPFGLASAVALAMTVQAWYASAGTERSLSFIFQGHLIRWYAWALLTPLLIVALRNPRLGSRSAGYRFLVYAGVGLASILAWAVLTGLGIGWWWSFPSLVPESPLWHARFELQHQAVLGAFVFALIVLGSRSRRLVRVEATGGAASRPGSSAVSVIALRTPERVVFLSPHQIDWLEADRDHVVVHARNGSHRVRERLSAFETRLPGDQFLRISRSAIVNVGAIAELQPWFRGNFIVILRSGARVRTGKTYRDRVRQLIR